MVRGTDGEYGLELLELDYGYGGTIEEIRKGSSADEQGIKENDYIFSIHKINNVGESHGVIGGLLQNSGSSVEIGVLKPKKFDPNQRKFSYSKTNV